MYRPDRIILRKIQEYDPHLLIEWNERRQFFEIWRRMPHGRRLITPVTQSIYVPGAPVVFTPLDERILWWLFQADGWNKSASFSVLDMESDRRFAELQRNKDALKREDFKAFGREMWQTLNQKFVTTHSSKNPGKPSFNKTNPYSQWVRPDVRLNAGSRLYQRSAANARLYGYRGK